MSYRAISLTSPQINEMLFASLDALAFIDIRILHHAVLSHRFTWNK